MKFIEIKAVQCPTCGSGEQHPSRDDANLIRAFKVHDGRRWWSQCLVCAGYYDKDLKETPDNYDRNSGWF